MKGNYLRSYSDFLVIGSGIAGLYASILASKKGKVALITKSTLSESNSFWAQGGIAAAVAPEDSPLFHLEDTVGAGRGLCNEQAVEVLVREGRDRVMDLINLGTEFDKGEHGLDLGLEGGHRKRRVLHAGGSSTGRKMVEALTKCVKESSNILVYEDTYVTELLSDGKRCFGALAFEKKSQVWRLLFAKSTILASGGASAIYLRTTNPPTATGDGIAAAYRAGAEIVDMEFVQFHPTALYTEGRESPLISEAVRGEGAYLLNHWGKRFMTEWHELAELAPRDVVSRAIFLQMKKSGKDHVFLSLSHLNPDFIKKRFPNIYEGCLKYRIDITKDPIPVAPAAHYTIGGVKTGLRGETNIEGLFACGEVACAGVHGANRLASNSLLECLVFAKRAAEAAAENDFSEDSLHHIPIDMVGAVHELPLHERFEEKETNVVRIKERLAQIMSENVGIVRDAGGLSRALSEIGELLKFYKGKTENPEGFELSNMLEVAYLITQAALMRTETRGAHIREDFPEEDPAWVVHIIQKKGSEPTVVR